MKKIHSLLLLSTFLLLLSGCAEENPTVPSVSTQAISDVKATRAVGGGNIFSNGGVAILTSGICWDTATAPTIDDYFTQSNSNAGSFSYDIKWLLPNTTYYVRAYATNSYGISYGQTVSFKTDYTPSVGDSTQGGIIAYLLQSSDAGYDPIVQHGLLVAPQDQNANCTWWNGTYTVTGATATTYGNGFINTNSIIGNQGVGNYAAKICDNLSLNGYSDWFLPCKAELNLLYSNRLSIGNLNTLALYWSSSEIDNDEVWVQDFSDGTNAQELKDNNAAVRACRNF